MIYEDVFNFSQPAGEPCMYVIVLVDYVAILT
jgi:hypothetical protein